MQQAQNQPGCGFNLAQEMARKQFPDYDKNLKLIENFSSPYQQRSAAVTLTIPVVFHVLHKGGSENISDAQIQSAVQILTRDFRKKNADTIDIVGPYVNLAANCNIEFKLASKDPDGKCTNGITRHLDTKTDWAIEYSSYTYTWPSDKYLNVYVVNSMPDAAGYTFLPGTAPAPADAIVILHNYVGEIGTGSVFGSRALIHEVGHWLGLSHVWGNTNNPGVACGDDGVSDTPITKGHYFCDLGNPVDCTPSVPENIQNYMEYAYCSNMFTIGQSNLMNGVLASSIASRNNVVSAANMIATGIVNPNYNCAPKPEFKAIDQITCENGSLIFYDQSYNGAISNWWWSSPAAQSISTLQNGLLTFVSPGLVPINLKVGNAFGADSVSKPYYVTVLSNNGTTINVSEGFETGAFPDNNWIASKPQYGGSFIQSQIAGATGQKSMYVNNYTDNPNEPIYLYSPKYDLNNVTGAQLSFKYAYAQQNGNNDRLRVYINTDCGSTWSMLYNKSGSALATADPANSSAFVPTASQWETEIISVSGFQGNSKVYFKFEFTTAEAGPGNNFYIDDINLSGTVGLFERVEEQRPLISVYPNPTNGFVELKSETRSISGYSIMDLAGKVIAADTQLNSKEVKLNLFGLSKGVYIIAIHSGAFTEYQKLMVD